MTNDLSDIYRRLDRLEKAIVINIILTAIVVGEKAFAIAVQLLS